MTVMANPFARPEFEMAELTKSINLLPNMYGRVGQLGLFNGRGIATRTVLVEYNNGVLMLLPTKPVGADGSKHVNEKRNIRSFVVPHIPHDGELLPDEYQNVRAFGSASELDTFASIMNRKLASISKKHAITLEHLRIGALKGRILDADGTVLYDLYNEFGIGQASVDFLLGTANTEIKLKCLALKRIIEDNLLGDIYTTIRVLVSPEFFDKLTTHPVVKADYQRWQDGDALRADNRKGFEYGGLIFEEYRGNAPQPDGATRRFIAAGEGHAFPEGTQDVFDEVYAPADFTETANTIGLPMYAKQEARRFNRGVDIHSQSNPLPYCTKPGVLVKVFSSN